MRTVNVGIRHDDYLVIAQLCYVELVAYTGAQCGYDGCQLVVAVHLVGSRLFDVEHLAPKREYRLESRIPALRCGAACGVALDDVQLGERSVPLVAVTQLIGHLSRLKPRLPADGLPRLSCGLSRPRCGHSLFEYRLADGGVLLQKLLQLIGHDTVHERAHFGVAELCLGLTLKLRLGELYGYDCGHTLAAVLA